MLATQLDISGRFALTIPSVFTPIECQELIDLAEASAGYRDATINSDGERIACKEIRDCLRWINDDPDLAGRIFARLRDHLPAAWEGKELSRLNNQLKFLKYGPGNFFKPHYDGEYTTPDGTETSYVTVQIYLNEGFHGGETTFLRFTGIERKKLHAIVPETGKVLIFEHELLHEGSEVHEGTKYVIRIDVMYK